MEELSREVVQLTADIVGPYSASARALAKADTMTDPVFLKTPDSLIVAERAALADFLAGDADLIDGDAR